VSIPQIDAAALLEVEKALLLLKVNRLNIP
jgi:hypothetical protein